MKNMCIYIHIPYCKKRCAYCSFFSSENRQDFASYFSALKSEAEKRAKDFVGYTVKSIYFGGGTPSYVPSEYIKDILLFLQKNFNIEKDAEITIEANPNTLSEKNAEDYIGCGINRFSIGLQTANDKLLALIGRIHTVNDFIRSVKLLHGFGVKNISADIMLGLPCQKPDDVKNTIDVVMGEEIRHISAYGLKVENGTKLEGDISNGKLTLPDEDACADMYDYTLKRLKSEGIYRYEVSNFAQRGFESRHNLNYWHRGEYLGLGAAAHSFINEERFYNVSDINKYIEKPFGGETREKISPKEAEFEYIMLGLRLDEGINLTEFQTLFNADFLLKYKVVLAKLKPFFILGNDKISVNDRGFNVLNSILTEFLI